MSCLRHDMTEEGSDGAQSARLMPHIIGAPEHLLYFPHDVDRVRDAIALTSMLHRTRINHRATRAFVHVHSSQPRVVAAVSARWRGRRRSVASPIAYGIAHSMCRAVRMRTSRGVVWVSAENRRRGSSHSVRAARTIPRHENPQRICGRDACQGIWRRGCETASGAIRLPAS